MMIQTTYLVLLVILVVIIFLSLYIFGFLRNSKRIVPKGDCIVSPANGRIAKIISIGKNKNILVKKGLLGKVKDVLGDFKEGYLIVIVMTPLNVHYQRSPVEGIVEKTVHTKGLFHNAMSAEPLKAGLENEKNEIIIKNRKIGSIKVVQVAGFLARRIHCFVTAGQKINKGEDIGLISLGSQVLLVIPKLAIKVKEGETVIDGETIIARF